LHDNAKKVPQFTKTVDNHEGFLSFIKMSRVRYKAMELTPVAWPVVALAESIQRRK
jgi:hypothetical protein